MGNYVMFVCDKCGMETKNYEAILPVWVLAPKRGEMFSLQLREHGETMGLCEKCRKEFMDYVDAWNPLAKCEKGGDHADA